MTRLFITGSGTGVGKTFVTARLAEVARDAGRSLRALKPIVSGFHESELADSDPGILLEAQGLSPERLDAISPWRFAAPLSPDIAAAREGRAIDFAQAVEFCRSAIAGPEEVVLIEGVGGVMVPLDSCHTVRDWIQALEMEVALVAGSYLGTLSHTLTAIAALEAAAISIRMVIVSESPESPVPLEETVGVLQRFAPNLGIMALPRQSAAKARGALGRLIGEGDRSCRSSITCRSEWPTPPRARASTT